VDTRARGDEAEAAVLHAFTRHGLAVWLPWSRFGACDPMIENAARTLVRAQVKSGRIRESCVLANTRSTDHVSGRQTYLGLADILVIHVSRIGEQFVIPVSEACGFDVRLRLSPARNNQRVGVRFARDYRLDDWARRFAVIGPEASGRESGGAASA
jgi:hypothetical protein